MATVAVRPKSDLHVSPSLPGRRYDHLFFSGMAWLMFAVVIVGFGPTYYFRGGVSRSAAQHDYSCPRGGVYVVDAVACDANVAGFGGASGYSSALGDGRVCAGVCHGGVGCTRGDRLIGAASGPSGERSQDLLHCADVGDAGVWNGDYVRVSEPREFAGTQASCSHCHDCPDGRGIRTMAVCLPAQTGSGCNVVFLRLTGDAHRVRSFLTP